MRLKFISAFSVAGLIIFEFVSSFADEATKESVNKGQTREMKGSANLRIRWGKTRGTTEINGEITDIQGDIVKTKDEKGNIQ